MQEYVENFSNKICSVDKITQRIIKEQRGTTTAVIFVLIQKMLTIHAVTLQMVFAYGPFNLSCASRVSAWFKLLSFVHVAHQQKDCDAEFLGRDQTQSIMQWSIDGKTRETCKIIIVLQKFVTSCSSIHFHPLSEVRSPWQQVQERKPDILLLLYYTESSVNTMISEIKLQQYKKTKQNCISHMQNIRFDKLNSHMMVAF